MRCSRFLWLLFIGSFLFPIGGCEPAKEGASEIAASVNAPLSLGNQETLAKWLEENRGKVVLVDFWATWCGPCVQQFPHTVSLSEKHRDEGLAVVSVSMNEPSEQESVQQFLSEKKALFDNLLTEYGAGAQFVEAFEIPGEVPFYKLYDRKGELRYNFAGTPDGIENCEPVDKIDERIAELLKE